VNDAGIDREAGLRQEVLDFLVGVGACAARQAVLEEEQRAATRAGQRGFKTVERAEHLE
jgi:hypothetical protein